MIESTLPPGAKPGTLHRIDSTENNVIARWRDLGSPAYLSRAQTRELGADNALRVTTQPVRVESNEGQSIARFTMERPGVALLEIAW